MVGVPHRTLDGEDTTSWIMFFGQWRKFGQHDVFRSGGGVVPSMGCGGEKDVGEEVQGKVPKQDGCLHGAGAGGVVGCGNDWKEEQRCFVLD
jgi:hypothetical protein